MRDAACPLFVELCAGTAAVSLRLHDAKARPLMGRMGSKRGYADAILAELGLAPGQTAKMYLWCEPDPLARQLLRLHTDPIALAQAVQDVYAFGDEDPRTLFQRLFRAHDASIARTYLLSRWAYRIGFPASGFNASPCKVRPKTATDHGSRGRTARTEAALLDRALTGLPAHIFARARLPQEYGIVPDGTRVYIDPSYVGTTGYDHTLTRAEAVNLARAWATAGARVAVSEAEPVAELVADGWRTVEITGRRTGQARTFSKQQREWLTLQHLPAPASVP